MHFGPYNLDPKAHNLIEKIVLVKGELHWALNGPFFRKTAKFFFYFLLNLQKLVSYKMQKMLKNILRMSLSNF